MAEEVYEKYASYDWDKDETFKAGLHIFLERQSIEAESPQAQSVESKYKFFYFSKRFGAVDRDGFDDWAKNQETTKGDLQDEVNEREGPDLSRPWFQQIPTRLTEASADSSDDPAEKGPSFDEIVELIQSAKPIPGIRQIPDQLNTETPSPSSSPVPKKPWEK